MSYVTVYDASRWSAVRWDHLALVASVCLFGLGAVAVGLRHKGAGATAVAGFFLAVFGGLMMFTASAIEFADRSSAEALLRRGAVQVAEGPVEMVHAMPFEGHDREHIRVGGRDFIYSDDATTQGFRHTTSHFGPLADGVRARLSYVVPSKAPGPIILKVEVARPPSPAS